MGSLWSSTPPMTVSRLPWMNCAAANSRTKSGWTGRSSWDWGRTGPGESYDSFGDVAGPEAQLPTTAITAAPDAGFNRPLSDASTEHDGTPRRGVHNAGIGAPPASQPEKSPAPPNQPRRPRPVAGAVMRTEEGGQGGHRGPA